MTKLQLYNSTDNEVFNKAVAYMKNEYGIDLSYAIKNSIK